MTDKDMELLIEENIPAKPTYPVWVMEVDKVDAEAFEKAKVLHDRAMKDEEFSSLVEYNPDSRRLEEAFFWFESDEGEDYWTSIYDKIENQCK